MLAGEKKEENVSMGLIGFYDYTVILTYLSLLSAVFGMHLAGQGHFTAAVLCLLFSGVCDAFDGIVARSKKGRTQEEKNFGIQIDSLVDVISFGVVPAVISYHMGVNGILGLLILFGFVCCAVIRLAFFNVLEEKRQREEGGCNKTYRGLPVTSVSILYPVFYILRFVVGHDIFAVLLHILLPVIAFLFILDFSVKKPDWLKLFRKK